MKIVRLFCLVSFIVIVSMMVRATIAVANGPDVATGASVAVHPSVWRFGEPTNYTLDLAIRNQSSYPSAYSGKLMVKTIDEASVFANEVGLKKERCADGWCTYSFSVMIDGGAIKSTGLFNLMSTGYHPTPVSVLLIDQGVGHSGMHLENWIQVKNTIHFPVYFNR